MMSEVTAYYEGKKINGEMTNDILKYLTSQQKTDYTKTDRELQSLENLNMIPKKENRSVD